MNNLKLGGKGLVGSAPVTHGLTTEIKETGNEGFVETACHEPSEQSRDNSDKEFEKLPEAEKQGWKDLAKATPSNPRNDEIANYGGIGLAETYCCSFMEQLMHRDDVQENAWTVHKSISIGSSTGSRKFKKTVAKPNGYSLFVRQKGRETGTTGTFSQLMTKFDAEWKKLSEVEKQEWKFRAKAIPSLPSDENGGTKNSGGTKTSVKCSGSEMNFQSREKQSTASSTSQLTTTTVLTYDQQWLLASDDEEGY